MIARVWGWLFPPRPRYDCLECGTKGFPFPHGVEPTAQQPSCPACWSINVHMIPDSERTA